jgi:hypothetical protein
MKGNCALHYVLQTIPSNGKHPLIQDGADMTPLKPTHLLQISSFTPTEGMKKCGLQCLPIKTLHQGVQLSARGRWHGVRTGHPSTPGGTERLSQHQRANARGETGQGVHPGRFQPPLSACMQGDSLEN